MSVKTACPCDRCQRYVIAERNIELASGTRIQARCVDCGDRHKVSVASLLRKHGEWACSDCAKGRGKR